MQIRSAEFITSGRGLADCPEWELPEFALIGRSNVGKSSLINLLANKKLLAKVSSVPGKTRQLNFFRINGAWCLVDLPGYGYSKTAKAEKFDFNELVGDYLEQRENLRHVFVLIDSRLPPQRIDLDFIAWLDGVGASFTLIFTKEDKQSAAKTQATVTAFQASIPPGLRCSPTVVTTSSLTSTGRNEILRRIEEMLQS